MDAYSIDRLETVYFTKQPTDEQAAVRPKEPRVSAAVNSGVFGKRPVYMVTGFQIARGLRVETGRGKESNIEVGIGAPIAAAAGVEVMVEVAGSRQEDVQMSYRTGNNVIFAYQLHVVAQGN